MRTICNFSPRSCTLLSFFRKSYRWKPFVDLTDLNATQPSDLQHLYVSRVLARKNIQVSVRAEYTGLHSDKTLILQLLRKFRIFARKASTVMLYVLFLALSCRKMYLCLLLEQAIGFGKEKFSTSPLKKLSSAKIGKSVNFRDPCSFSGVTFLGPTSAPAISIFWG